MDPQNAIKLAELELVRNRREPASHPGPAIQRDYLTPLNFDAAGLAKQVGMDAVRLQRMLDGTESIDVESAIRLARSLQLNPRTIVERQARHDFARLRNNAELESIPVLSNDGRVDFPEAGYLRGRLSGLRENSPYGGVRDETLGFFADGNDDTYPPSHAYSLEPGAKLRIYGEGGDVIYVGVFMRNLEGRPLLPFVRPNVWINWFTDRLRADYFVPL
jgi:addiction module HigA family antidote